QAGDRHETAHALGDLVEAWAVAVRTALAEARDAGIDDLRVDAGELAIVDAEPPLHVGAKVLHHDVGLLHHALERRQPFPALQVERHAALVAVQVVEVRPLARPTETFTGLGVRRHLDLDDVGAPVGELAHAGGTGAHAGEIEDREPGQSL